ncbi:TetR/AcrR family transcriptional regulator C-terminal domain-containing protein [Leucobacter sp. CSA1]|uniref:TetR/AcrR family transcriptional regulator C-terminal domain-containing protein n=1 Tax=Leucobacter chromiisoli TaxID=2796471 RepID=A0A934UUD2_9MICO|nr:TetR/AcrR family transcriptional regulator C-terminal domain-containing protein [Leucobacter chromiisoli]MBK0419359.1 TetR/AcrR family transcriptional regulator C-terminal domain-containing protein [Leucobacter chromiisoli]
MSETGVPRTLALAWGLAAAPQRGPKRELTLERIVEAAIAIADAEGLAAVTMQRVAKTFEFSTMALYRYVATKEELHHLMLDAALGGAEVGGAAAEGAASGGGNFAPAASGDWREELGSFVRGLVEGYRRHPWALDISLAPDIHLMPGQIRVADRGLRVMRDLPLPPDAKLGVLSLLAAFARGQADVEREVLAGAITPAETRALIEEAVTPAQFPQVAALVRTGVYFGDPPAGETARDRRSDADEMLDFSTQVLVAGLSAILSEMPETPAEAESRGREPTPREAYEAAETELREHVELRKRTQRRVRELEREEAALAKARDRAKEFAKADARRARG